MLLICVPVLRALTSKPYAFITLWPWDTIKYPLYDIDSTLAIIVSTVGGKII
jgi:hypothetical protein